MVASAKVKTRASQAPTRVGAMDWPDIATHLDGNGWGGLPRGG
ncbi:MAG TPA: proline hydroxylase, partial [Afipia sp.]|nr:proline hydroxylase [Afipia sp.]